MKKNVLITIVVILVVVALIVGAIILLNNKGEEKTIDVDAAGQTLANSTPFNELATMDITTEELGSLYGINTEKLRSFELFRKNIYSPEIITFDELYERAKFITKFDN